MTIRETRTETQCYPCTIHAYHPWHDNGTVNPADMQAAIDSYSNTFQCEREDAWRRSTEQAAMIVEPRRK